MVAEGQSDTMVSDMELSLKQRCVIEFFHEERMASSDIHECLLNFYGDQTVDVSIVRWWVVRFSSSNSVSSPLAYIFTRCGMDALVHHWQKCTANGGDCAEKIVFCS